LGLWDAVVFAGRVPHDDLVALYSGAGGLVLPSLDEGFGLPVLEAMACGCPVVVSSAASLAEIAADAAVVVDRAHDHELLAAKLGTVLASERLRARLSARGLARAERFPWRLAAARTLAVYRGVTDASSTRINPGRLRPGLAERRGSLRGRSCPAPRWPCEREERPASARGPERACGRVC
jgi:glycosyltransferase involved in cell wall biosynthesis